MLASIPQGFQLRLDAEKLGVPLNAPQTNGSLMMASKKEIKLAKGLSFIVAGPMQPDLLTLQQQHDDWLKELKKAGKKPEDTLSAFVDKSVPNLSSIVVLAKAGGKTILLTGDARGDKILEGLEQAGADRGARRHAPRRCAESPAPRQLEQRGAGVLPADHGRSLRVLGRR